MEENGKRLILIGSISMCIIIFCIQYAVGKLAYSDETKFFSYGSKSYGILAESVISSGEISRDGVRTAGRPPLYPLFLAALGLQPNLILVGQSLLAGMTIGILAGIYVFYTRSLWNTIWLVGLYLLTIQIAVENITQRETVLFTTFLAIGSLTFVLARKRQFDIYSLCVFAVSLGLAALTRPLEWLGFYFAIIVAMSIFYLDLRGKALFLRPILFTGVFLLTLLPWGIRNSIALDKFILSSTTRGINLWKGNNPATPAIYPALDVDNFDHLLANPPETVGWWEGIRAISELSEVERDEFLTTLALNHIKDNPGEFLRQIPVKIWALWTPRHVPIILGRVSWTTAGIAVENQAVFADYRLNYGLLYVFTLIGFWKWKGQPYTIFVISLIVFFSLIHGMSFGESRFRWPMNVLFFPIAVAGIESSLLKLRLVLTTIQRKASRAHFE